MGDLDYVPYPESEKFTSPKREEPGQCICGAVLPPESEWIDAGRDWSHVTCLDCGRAYVDEGDYFAIYDDGMGDTDAESDTP